MMIDEAGEKIVKRPAPNQRCPCRSNKVYKKCACAVIDKTRTEKFITDLYKEMAAEQPAKKSAKGNEIIMV